MRILADTKVKKQAIASSIHDYEDAVVEKAAHRNDMDYIVTRNIKGYQAGDTKIILPDDFPIKVL